MARILALSSHVVRGSVGLAATVPALQSLGHEVWALPTVILAARPGLGHAAFAPGGRWPAGGEELSGLLEALEQDACWPMLDAVFTGYFASAAAVAAVGEILARIKAANPKLKVLVDPIIGDAGRLYVPAETAQAIAHRLLPLADIATPNHFELQWLSGQADPAFDIEAAARALGPGAVVVTSARVSQTQVTTLLVTSRDVHACTTPHFHDVPNGSGDLFDGLFLGHLLAGHRATDALDRAVASVTSVLAASARHEVLQLSALNAAAR